MIEYVQGGPALHELAVTASKYRSDSPDGFWVPQWMLFLEGLPSCVFR
jgi:hypothetical protein